MCEAFDKFALLRLKSLTSNLSRSNAAFRLNSYEFDPKKELDYLRIFIDALLLNLFMDENKAYFRNAAIRSLLREIILNKGDLFEIFNLPGLFLNPIFDLF